MEKEEFNQEPNPIEAIEIKNLEDLKKLDFLKEKSKRTSLEEKSIPLLKKRKIGQEFAHYAHLALVASEHVPSEERIGEITQQEENLLINYAKLRKPLTGLETEKMCRAIIDGIKNRDQNLISKMQEAISKYLNLVGKIEDEKTGNFILTGLKLDNQLSEQVIKELFEFAALDRIITQEEQELLLWISYFNGIIRYNDISKFYKLLKNYETEKKIVLALPKPDVRIIKELFKPFKNYKLSEFEVEIKQRENGFENLQTNVIYKYKDFKPNLIVYDPAFHAEYIPKEDPVLFDTLLDKSMHNFLSIKSDIFVPMLIYTIENYEPKIKEILKIIQTPRTIYFLSRGIDRLCIDRDKLLETINRIYTGKENGIFKKINP